MYDLRVNYRQSYYYWDQNDNALLPNGLHGLTTNHNWATVRRFGSLNFLLHATNNLRFRFEYGRNAQRRNHIYHTSAGLLRRTRQLGDVPSRQSILRDWPCKRDSNRIAGGVDYTVRDWTIHYTVGYQTFDQAFNWTNPVPERSININSTANVNELLANGNWTEIRRLNTPSSELFFNGKVTSETDLARRFPLLPLQRPVHDRCSYNGTARANTSERRRALRDFAQLQGTGHEPNYVLDQGFTFKLKEWWNFDADYRFNRFTESGTANFWSDPFQRHQRDHNSAMARESQPTGSANGVHSAPGLVISPGVRLMKRDVVAIDDGQVDPGRTLRTKTAWPIGSLFYQPWKNFSIRGDFQSITNNTSYTRITPHTDVGTRWVFRLRLTHQSLDRGQSRGPEPEVARLPISAVRSARMLNNLIYPERALFGIRRLQLR